MEETGAEQGSKAFWNKQDKKSAKIVYPISTDINSKIRLWNLPAK